MLLLEVKGAISDVCVKPKELSVCERLQTCFSSLATPNSLVFSCVWRPMHVLMCLCVAWCVYVSVCMRACALYANLLVKYAQTPRKCSATKLASESWSLPATTRRPPRPFARRLGSSQPRTLPPPPLLVSHVCTCRAYHVRMSRVYLMPLDMQVKLLEGQRRHGLKACLLYYFMKVLRRDSVDGHLVCSLTQACCTRAATQPISRSESVTTTYLGDVVRNTT